jgi:hypothetical protein
MPTATQSNKTARSAAAVRPRPQARENDRAPIDRGADAGYRQLEQLANYGLHVFGHVREVVPTLES